MLSYKEQIKNGKWLKFRDSVFKRDNYKCRICQSENSLQAHHLYYLPNTLAWDYDIESVITICAEHHGQLTFELPKLAGLIAFEILREKYNLL